MASAEQIAQWRRDGAPGFQPTDVGGTIYERPVVIPPTDSRFNLALAEAIENAAGDELSKSVTQNTKHHAAADLPPSKDQKSKGHDMPSSLLKPDTEHEIPEALGKALFDAQELAKGAGHKYIRRVPKAGGGFRYFYTVQAGAGIGHESELVVGAAFKVEANGKAGHFHVVSKDAEGNVVLKHDESGVVTSPMPAVVVQMMLHKEHATAIEAHKAKSSADLADAKAHGANPKQLAKLVAAAEKFAPPKAPEPVPKAPTEPAGDPVPKTAKKAPVGSTLRIDGLLYRKIKAEKSLTDGDGYGYGGQWQSEAPGKVTAMAETLVQLAMEKAKKNGATVTHSIKGEAAPKAPEAPPSGPVASAFPKKPIFSQGSQDNAAVSDVIGHHLNVRDQHKAAAKSLPKNDPGKYKHLTAANLHDKAAKEWDLARKWNHAAAGSSTGYGKKPPEEIKAAINTHLSSSKSANEYSDEVNAAHAPPTKEEKKAAAAALKAKNAANAPSEGEVFNPSQHKHMVVEHRDDNTAHMTVFAKAADAKAHYEKARGGLAHGGLKSIGMGNVPEGQSQGSLHELVKKHFEAKAKTPPKSITTVAAAKPTVPKSIHFHDGDAPGAPLAKSFDPAAVPKHKMAQSAHEALALQAQAGGDHATAKGHLQAAKHHGKAAEAHEAGRDSANRLGLKARETSNRLAGNGQAPKPRTADKPAAPAPAASTPAAPAPKPATPATPAAKPAAPAPKVGEGAGNAAQTTSAQVAAQKAVASGAVTDKPNAGAQAAGGGGKSSEGLKVIAIGPRGGKIVGYTTNKEGKRTAIYEGSAAAQKMAGGKAPAQTGKAPADEAPVAGKGGDYHRAKQADHAKAAAAASAGGDAAGAAAHTKAADEHWRASLQNDRSAKGIDAAGASESADEASAKAGAAGAKPDALGDSLGKLGDATKAHAAAVKSKDPAKAKVTKAKLDAAHATTKAAMAEASNPAEAPHPDPSIGPDGQPVAGGGQPEPPPAPAAPIDNEPLSPDAAPGGTPEGAPDPESLGTASPKTDSPEARHAAEIAKMKAQVEDAYKRLDAMQHHIDAELVPLFNRLKSDARRAHQNPSKSTIGWLLSRVTRFAAMVLGLHEDKGKVELPQSPEAKRKGEPQKEKRGATGSDGREFDENPDGSFTETEASKAKSAKKARPPQTRIIEKSMGDQAVANALRKSLNAHGFDKALTVYRVTVPGRAGRPPANVDTAGLRKSCNAAPDPAGEAAAALMLESLEWIIPDPARVMNAAFSAQRSREQLAQAASLLAYT